MPVEPAQDRLATRALGLFIGESEALGQQADRHLRILARRLGFLLGRHLAEVELVEHALPDLEVLYFGEIPAEGVETDFALLLVGTVAPNAMFAQEGGEF